jgi:hypothetical protein
MLRACLFGALLAGVCAFSSATVPGTFILSTYDLVRGPFSAPTARGARSQSLLTFLQDYSNNTIIAMNPNTGMGAQTALFFGTLTIQLLVCVAACFPDLPQRGASHWCTVMSAGKQVGISPQSDAIMQLDFA